MTFRGASADALAGLTGELAATPSGTDLFAVAELLRAEPALRRVTTDVSGPGEAQAGLVHQVFGNNLVASAVTRRWTASRDLADALEQLGVIAVVRSAGADAGRLADELFTFGQAVKDNPELRDALSEPARTEADKRALVRSLLEGKALPATVTLAEQALSGSYRTVGAALAAYQQIAADVHGQNVATVRVARPLSDIERERLTESLTRQYDRRVHLNVVVDPRVLGGMRVEIGDDVIDGTVINRLADARRRLAG